MRDYKYNILKDDIFYVKEDFKIKGKEYGIAKLNNNQINILTESIDLMSVSPSTSVKFSKRIEDFLDPRFQEIIGASYTNKTLPDIIGIELSKENHKDLLNGLTFSNVTVTLKSKKYPVGELITKLTEVKFTKFK